jgi:hypothetical protein
MVIVVEIIRGKPDDFAQDSCDFAHHAQAGLTTG